MTTIVDPPASRGIFSKTWNRADGTRFACVGPPSFVSLSHALPSSSPPLPLPTQPLIPPQQPTDLNLTLAPLPASPTTHLLRIHALSAAVLGNSTRTSPPTTVDVDIILDPYTLHYLPRSLEPAAAYTLLVAAFALPLAHLVAHFLLTPATRKLHRE